MTAITIDRAVLDQVLEALEPLCPPYPHAQIGPVAQCVTALRAALAQKEQAEPVPPANIIGHLESRRLVRLLQELYTVAWESDDEGWNKAIEAVCQRIDKELLEVVDWVNRKEVSEATMTALLQKMMKDAK